MKETGEFNGEVEIEQRLTVFSKRGVPIAELDAAVQATWVQGGLGRLEFSLSRRDAKCSQRNLQFGNFVLFEAAGLPAWGGLLWPPRGWGQGRVTLQALSAEFQFKRRIVSRARANLAGQYDGQAASLFAQLIELGNEQADMRIEAGTLAGAGDALSVQIRQQSIWDALRDLQESSGQEWWLEPEMDADKRLLFRAHWALRRGKARNLQLNEGQDFVLAGDAIEDGALLNRVLVLGEGAAQPPASLAMDTASQGGFGATFFAEVLETADQAVLDARAKELLRENSQPRLRITARMVGEAAFRHIRLGDHLHLALHSVGFTPRGVQAPARVLGMEYRAIENSLKVVVEQTGEFN